MSKQGVVYVISCATPLAQRLYELVPLLQSGGSLTVAKFHRLSYTIFNFLMDMRDLDGKTRTETLARGCGGS